MRNELGIENKFVIGHSGRFNEQKNQDMILKLKEIGYIFLKGSLKEKTIPC